MDSKDRKCYACMGSQHFVPSDWLNNILGSSVQVGHHSKNGMTLLIRNLQTVIKFHSQILYKDTRILRKLLNIEQVDVAVICVDNKEIQEMNRNYRNFDEPTDVLSFPTEQLVPGQLPNMQTCSDLGDIFLGMPYIYSQCFNEGSDIQTVLPVLVAHGLCHLLGYDHSTHQQWQQMFQKESEILMKFNEIVGSSLQPLTAAFNSQERA